MPRKPFDLENFILEFAATEKDVAEGKAKRCTKHNCPCGNEPLLLDAFYNDKSNRTGKAPWCKAAEASYNKKYTEALKTIGALKKMDLDDEVALQTFEAMMQSERKPRKVQVEVEVKSEVPTEAPKAEKAEAKKSAPRKRTPRKKAEEVIPL